MLPIGLLLVPAATQRTLPVSRTAAPAADSNLLTFFLPDSEPTSLDASIVAINTVVTVEIETIPVTTLEIACPTAASPENDACRAAGIYPARVYHTQGSVWGGTTTDPADDSTTTWRCELGGGGIRVSADCSKTVLSGRDAAATTRTESNSYDNCYVLAHRLPIVVTGGLELMDPRAFMTGDASSLNSAYSSLVAEAGCPASKTTMWAAAAAKETDASGEIGNGPVVTSPSQPNQPGGAPTPTPTGNTASGRGSGWIGTILGVGATAVLGMAF